MQYGVVLADAVVGCGAVLEMVAVFFRLDVLSPGGHLGGGDGEAVFAFEPAAVVGVVQLQDIPLELLVGFQLPGLVAQGQSGLAELVVDFESGEHEGVVVELAGHGLGDVVAGDAGFLKVIRWMCSQEKRRGLLIGKIRFAFRWDLNDKVVKLRAFDCKIHFSGLCNLRKGLLFPLRWL